MKPSPAGGSPASGLVGYLEVLAAAGLWGSSGIFSVHLFRMGVPPESVALLRPVLGLGFLAVLVAVRRPAAFRPGARGLLFLAGIGGLLTGVFQVAYQVAIDLTGVPTTVALVYLAPALVIAVAGPVLGKWPSRRRVGLAALSVAGVWLTVAGARGAEVEVTPPGVALGALSGATYAGYTLFGRYASPRWGSFATVLWSTAGACVLLAVGLPLVRGGVVLPGDPRAWGLLTVFGLLTIATATFLFYDGLGRMEAGRAAIASTAEPVVAALLATWLLGQGLAATGWVGLALVVAGVAGAYGTPAPAPHE